MTEKIIKRIVTETINKDGSKKTIIKEHTPRTLAKKPAKKRMTASEREKLLIENFVGLQHAMTNMSIKFGSLADNLEQLLKIFEEAAKNFASGEKGDDKDMLNKIDSLLNQNKTIAKGLVLMEEKLRGRAYESEALGSRTRTSHIRPKPLPSI